MSNTKRNCGFIGLGHLGVYLAASLIRAGHNVTIHDLNKSLGDGLIAKGAKWANSAREVAQASEVVFTCLPSPRAIDAVVNGENGVLSGLAKGATWIDMSTNDRSETLRLGEIAAKVGVNTLESPVTGGVHKAAEGDITVLVGGDGKIFAAHKDLLEAMGKPVLYVGELGSAA